MSEQYKLLLLDLDGTLVGEQDSISERTINALSSARKAGCTPVICTGRSRYTSRNIVQQLGNNGYGIFLNGATVWRIDTDDLVRKTPMTQITTSRIIEQTHAHDLAPFCFGVDPDDRWIHTDRVPLDCPHYVRYYTERLVLCKDLTNELPTTPVSIEAYGKPDEIADLVADWRKACGEEITVYTWPEDGGAYMGAHAHSSETGKAAGAQAVCDILGVKRKQTLAIGDQVNDIEMLQWAGFGVAMGDARPEVISAADHVTAAFADDGAARAIERFVLS